MEKLTLKQASEFLEITKAEVMEIVKSGLLPYQEIQCKEKCCLFFNKSDLIKFKDRRKKT
jgi:hypothetical protein